MFTMVNKENDDKDSLQIRVSNDIYSWLESKKIHPRQSFNEVLEQIKNDTP